MTDLFAQQLQALRARSLDRHLREIASAQGPTIEIVGQQLASPEGEQRRLLLWQRIKLMQELLPVRSATANRPDKNAGHLSSAIFPCNGGAP
jgi:hypothetical protein